jgi:UDP-N-acetylglucosamine/UDP-N-acetylgalactosamine diphosphorylase
MAIASQSQLAAKLAPFGQEHLLAFWDELNETQREQLARQIEALDLPFIARLAAQTDSDEGHTAADMAARAAPCQALRLDGAGAPFTREQAIERGEASLKAGEVGLLLVAGGQGTRLGFPHPKGMFPLGPVSGRTLFQMLFDQARAAERRYRARLPLYIMTSPATDEETRSFLDSQNWFGLAPRQVNVFCQGVMPAIDAQSKELLLAEKHELFLAPDGHGGMLAAFQKSGSLADAQSRGVKHLFYAQIDNPLVRFPDPLLIGCHLLAESEMTTQVVVKNDPLQRVGNVVSVDGRTCIIEYSDLPREVAEQRNADGSLRLWAGNLAIHVLDLAFLARVADDADGLPFHRALKASEYIDAAGVKQKPAAPNAIKFERFIFDLLPAARRAFSVETVEADTFAPVKNATGVDTPETSRAMLVARDRRRLRAAGAVVDDSAVVEISPLFAWTDDELAARIKPGQRIADGSFLVG